MTGWRRVRIAGLAAVHVLVAGSAVGHEAQRHDTAPPVVESADPSWQPGTAPAGAPAPFGLDVGGPFDLVAHTGESMTDADFRGRLMLVFFGYARCEGMCPVGLRRMTEAVDLLGAAGREVQPLLITIDPAETPAVLAGRVGEIHPRLIGLSGSPARLAAAARAFEVDSDRVGHAPDGSPIFRHGSYIYVMGRDGDLLSILPPVLPAAAMAEVLRRHVTGAPPPEG